jgi:adenylate cyclase
VTKKAPDLAVEPEAVRAQLARILSSDDFDASPRSRSFLRFVVEETLAGRQDGLTQDAIATKVFGRREDFDPTVDPIVRIQAGRLRRSLERYHLLGGAADPLRIELPRGTYMPVLRRAEAAERAGFSAREAPEAAGDGWPTVVVCLPETPAADAELVESAPRYLDHLAVELGRYRDVRVVLRHEPLAAGSFPAGAARFLLTGTLSREEGGPCLIARLVDGDAGSQVWAEEYRQDAGPPHARFEKTARIVAAAVASEQGVVAKRLWAERRARPAREPTAYGAILDSYEFLFHRDPADLGPAIAALRRVVGAQPECSLAWVQLCRLHTSNVAFEISPLETPIDEAVTYAQNGVRLDPSGQRARTTLAAALLLKGELAAARGEAQAALDLNQDSLVYHEWIGWILTLCGEWDRGPQVVRQALARNPHVVPVGHHALWLAHLRRGEMDEAYQAALQFPDPTFYLRAQMRACCLGHLGKHEQAKAQVAELVARKPDFARRGRVLIGRLVKFPDLVERVVEGLEKAGLALD